ncbi:MAG: hypothetical protein LC796_01700 [Acidobacteria bacterium]|nr:hypothetical protein [Acidobacteriota bacterium]MCA1611157.1 hypothetical protein [Acidobacteriota bacterium]
MGVFVPPPSASGRPPARGAAAGSPPRCASDGDSPNSRFSAWKAQAREWCGGRSWLWRAPLVLYFAWSGLRRLRDPLAADLFGGITLGVHELGHLILASAGRWPSVAGGSLAQVAAPVAAGWVLARQRDWFGITVAGAWLASSLFGLAAYVGDARAQELPLVGLVPDPIHDWNWMLSRLGLLDRDRGLAALTRGLSFAIWTAAVIAGAWLCREMALWKKAETRGSGTES